MGSGHMMMVAVAILLLGKLVLSGNEMLSTSDDALLESEAIATATSVGQSMLERITCKGFDQAIGPYQNPAPTSFASIGIDGGEVAGKDTTFNDMDDYNGFVDSVNTPRFGKYYVTCAVYFVTEASPYDSTVTKTRMKRIDVRVNNKYMVDASGKNPDKLTEPLTLYQMVSYY